MNTTDQNDTPNPFKSAIKAAVGLGLFAVLTAGLIAFVKLGTNDRIVEQETKARLANLYALVPEQLRNNDLLADSYNLIVAEDRAPRQVFIARQDGTTTAFVMPWIAPDGYTAPIELLVAITRDAKLLGVRVTNHKETPGLGDGIELSKSDWILSFDGRSLDNTSEKAWQVKKDGGEFDQMTGATITPRAVVSAVFDSLKFFRDHKQQLLNQPAGATLTLGSTPSSGQ